MLLYTVKLRNRYSSVTATAKADSPEEAIQKVKDVYARVDPEKLAWDYSVHSAEQEIEL